jgi:hypothetical protein
VGALAETEAVGPRQLHDVRLPSGRSLSAKRLTLPDPLRLASTSPSFEFRYDGETQEETRYRHLPNHSFLLRSSMNADRADRKQGAYGARFLPSAFWEVLKF